MTATAAEETVRIPAVLRAVGTMMFVDCVVETWKQFSSYGKAYTRCRIANDPPHLPDGPYILEFAGQFIRTNRVDGRWELVFLAPNISIDTSLIGSAA
ncbi:MAG TPA: hypothetical protein VKT75_01295 [Acidobacteriaceae bacterium]|nr:hypothetical protein [Acidobacteriaceae bacterium]